MKRFREYCFFVITLLLVVPALLNCGGSESSSVLVTGVDDAYYVSPDGSDDNPGTLNEPWQTIGKAAETLVAGDTVFIRQGTYYERVVPINSGISGKRITYAAYSGEQATINGTDVSINGTWGGLLEISELSFITLNHLRVVNAGTDDNHNGILVQNSNEIIIQNCYTYNTVSSGIAVWESRNVVIDGNEVELACNDGEQECITIACTNVFRVSNNIVHHSGPGSIGGEGIDVKDGSSHGAVCGNRVHHINRLGIYIDAWDKNTHNIDVYSNTVYDCKDDGFALASEAGGHLHDISIFNNLAYSNKNSGLTIAGWGEPVGNHPISNILVINNTFFNNGTEGWGVGISIENYDADEITIRNNILSQNLYAQIFVEEVGGGLVVDHNLFYGTGEPYGSDYIDGDPRFIDQGNFDLHLQPTSPAIGSGLSIRAPSEDFDGNLRPQGEKYDIGAYECTGTI